MSNDNASKPDERAKVIEECFTTGLESFANDMLSGIDLFSSGISSSASLAQRIAYIAFMCGGGEIALYSLLGAYFRQNLHPEYLLSIDAQWLKTGLRPDFQVYEKEGEPLYAVEFKALDVGGETTYSQARDVIKAFDDDITKLAYMREASRVESKPTPLTAFVAFIRYPSDWASSPKSKIDSLIKKSKTIRNPLSADLYEIILPNWIKRPGTLAVSHLRQNDFPKTLDQAEPVAG